MPFCSCDGRQASLWYLPARWRDTTRQRGRVTYRTLQIQFTLDDAQLAALKDELLYSQPVWPKN
jgi:hypothetical protein